MTTCPSCGAENPEGFSFCGSCGAALGPAGADQRDVVLPLRPQDLADLAEQRVDGVTNTVPAELAEGGQVAADLGRVDVRVGGDLLRGDPPLPILFACVNTWRYRDRRAATPTVSRSPVTPTLC